MKDEFKKSNLKYYSTILYQMDFLAWGCAVGKKKIKNKIRRYSRRKLNQNLRREY